ncbi:MAG: protein kinase [Acidobacteriota bacterium]
MKLIMSPGTVVADRFTIVRFIAEGGMGEVYEARDRLLDESIAIKFLSRRNIGDRAIARRFQREIQLARKVTHPNVCRLFDVYETPLDVPSLGGSLPVTFVTMELLHGETLEDYLAKKGALDTDQALDLTTQMCAALSAAHDAGVVHRDFKSNNVMLVPTESGTRVVVTDFGLARSILPNDPSRTPLTADQLILGTAEYMAPEQIKGEPVSLRSDLYALGVVLFEMVTGRKPYSAANPMQLLVKRVSEPPARPRDFKPEISQAWEEVIHECLAEDPEDRPSSAGEIVGRLGGVSWGARPQEGAPGAGVAAPQAAGAARRTSPALWISLAALLLASLAFWASRPAEKSQAPGLFNPSRVTTGAGLEFDGSFSPDGRRAVYSGEGADGTFSLFIQELNSTRPPRRLAAGEGQAIEPEWEPAGPRIVYTARDSGGLWLTDSEGAEPRPLVAYGARATWSPDGSGLAFQTESSPFLAETAAPALSPSVIATLDLESGRVRRLTEPSSPPGGHASPTWTPSGRHVVFNATLRSEGELWAVDVDSGELLPLVREPVRAFDPALSRDGRTLFFAGRSREVTSLWRLDLDPATLEPRGAPEEVAGVGLSSIRQPHLSRDGRHLLYSAYQTRSNLWRLELKAAGRPAGPPQPLTRGNDRHNRPSFAPNAPLLAFDHWSSGVDIDVFLEPLGGGERRRLTAGEGTNSHASWLPDGRIAYTSTSAEGAKTLRALDPETSEDESLLSLEGDADWATVSRAGDRVAFHSPRGGQGLDVWIHDLGQASPWRLTFHEESAAFPAWSQDGQRLAYQVRQGEGTSHLWVAPLDGGEPVVVVTEPGHSWPYSFSPDGRRVLYAAQRGGVWNLWWVDLETRDRRQLTDNRAITGYLRYPVWSPDGAMVVYEKAETISDLFLVTNYLEP